MTSNVLDVFNRASESHIREGMAWYDAAHEFARSLDYRFHRAAGVIAALSPMNKWPNNKAKAAQLYRQGHGEGCGLFRNVDKAMAIYNGEDALDVLGGDKVRSFYLTIVDPAGDHSPVIDRHAFDIAVGMRTSDKVRSLLGRKGEYDRFATVYRDAACSAGIGASQLQAITWCAWRDWHGILD
jgi:hypothetical protein